MTFIPFELERWQSTWENRVRFNLAESGVHPLSVSELLSMTDTDPSSLQELRLVYSQSNGTDQLREAIAALYPGATEANVLVTTGGAEANFLTCWTLVERGDPVTIEVPNYLQTWGITRSLGADVNTFALDGSRAWQPDPDAIRAAIRADTKLVVVTNPNNPTGQVLSAEARAAILDRVRDTGAWLLADEVYQGAELAGGRTESFWGSYDRLIITNGLSKAYGLPGLRLGWMVGPAEFIEEAWGRHDYTVIGPSSVSDFLGVRALACRDAILTRTREILGGNYELMANWLRSLGDQVSWHPPKAGAICLVEYHLPMESGALVEHFRAEHGLLLVPGTHLGLSNHLRLGFGERRDYLSDALDILKQGLAELHASPSQV